MVSDSQGLRSEWSVLVVVGAVLLVSGCLLPITGADEPYDLTTEEERFLGMWFAVDDEDGVVNDNQVFVFFRNRIYFTKLMGYSGDGAWSVPETGTLRTVQPLRTFDYTYEFTDADTVVITGGDSSTYVRQ